LVKAVLAHFSKGGVIHGRDLTILSSPSREGSEEPQEGPGAAQVVTAEHWRGKGMEGI